MTDLSKLSTEDLLALKSGDLSKVSTEGLMALKGTKAKRPEPEEGALESIPIAAGRTVDRVLDGLTQMYLGARGEKSALGGLKQRAEEKDALYAPLQEKHPFSTGVGEALPSMVVPMGGAATMVGTAGKMALAGAIPGLLEYGGLDERLTRGAVGAAAGAALPLSGAALKTGKAVIEPLYEGGRRNIAGRTLNRVAGDDAGNVMSRLRSAQPLVPGSMPTAAQVAENGGIAALERSASASNPTAYTQRAMEQSSARLGALRGIAGDDVAMEAAKKARSSAADALYSQADAAVIPVDSFFKGLQMRPQFNAAVKRAEQLAKDEGVADIFFRQNGKPVALLGQGAHYIKKALDEAAEYGSSSYTSKAGSQAASKTQEQFLSWLEKSVPEYGQARQAFAKGSRPINQMEIGQELLGKLEPALNDFGALGSETSAKFASALRNADQTAARATGMSGAKLESVMEPGQMDALTGIAKDLARKSNAQNLGRGVGSDTFQKLSMQNIAEQSGMPRLTGGLLDLPGVSRFTQWAYRDTDQKMQSLLADALLEPKKAAELMEKADKRWLANHPKVKALLQQTAARGAGLLGLSGASMALPQ